MRIARVFGISVHLHWAWVFIPLVEYYLRRGVYDSVVWNLAEVVSLFGIVLLHEFGHALATRSVGGRADHIMLWPLGGVAYVKPPARPGALLWSIAAGPLVNVVLVPLTIGAVFAVGAVWPGSQAYQFAITMAAINVGLLVFNSLPVYPLDGGQVLRALLWYVIGRDRSLTVAAGVGLVGAAVAIGIAVIRRDVWLGVLAWYAATSSWRGLAVAKAQRRISQLPRHADRACPQCGESPLAGELWVCGRCKQRFDTFVTRGGCPECGEQYDITMCPFCRNEAPIGEWEDRATGS